MGVKTHSFPEIEKELELLFDRHPHFSKLDIYTILIQKSTNTACTYDSNSYIYIQIQQVYIIQTKIHIQILQVFPHIIQIYIQV